MIPFTLKNGPDGDLDMSKGLQFTTTLPEYVAQRIDENLSFFLGEWFLDLRQGLPYLQQLIGAKPDLPLLDTIFRRGLGATPGVGTVKSMRTEFDGSTRTAGVRFEIKCKDGSTITEAQLRAGFLIKY